MLDWLISFVLSIVRMFLILALAHSLCVISRTVYAHISALLHGNIKVIDFSLDIYQNEGQTHAVANACACMWKFTFLLN
jgi:hypothetical protein